MFRTTLLSLILLSVACKGGGDDPASEADADTDADTDSDTDTDTDTDADTDSDTDADTDADTDSDTDTDTGTFNCTDDSLEPNDDIAQATGQTSGTDLVSADNNIDYFAIPVAANEELTADVFFLDDLGDIDIDLYDELGASLGASSSTTDDEQIVWTNLTGADTTVYLAVDMFTNGGCNEYDFETSTVLVAVPECTTPDAFEPSDAASPSVTDSATGLNISDTDEDAYSMAVDINTQVNIAVTYDDTFGDLDLELRDSAGTVLDSDTFSGAVTWFNDSGVAADVTLVVTNTDSVCQTYDFASTFVLREPDVNEPNDTFDMATAASSGTGLNVSDGDDDWFAFEIPAGQEATVDVTFIDANGDIDATLNGADGTGGLAFGSSTSDNEQLVYLNSGTDPLPVTLQVRMFTSGGYNTYDFNVSFATP